MVIALAAAGFVGEVAGAEPTVPPARIPVTITSEPLSDQVVVVRGDHLWKISARHLDGVLGRPPANREIVPYWREVIAGNADRLRSGDPDLIYPGELVLLPPVSR